MGFAFMASFRECPECGKEFSLFTYDTKNYVYKVIDEGHIKYLCSYPCYRKYKQKVIDKVKER